MFVKRMRNSHERLKKLFDKNILLSFRKEFAPLTLSKN